MLPTWNLNKNTQIFIDLATWILNLSNLGNMLLQGLFSGELNRRCLFKNMATQAGLNLRI